MSRLLISAIIIALVGATPALAQDEDFDYLKRMQNEASTYLDEAQSAAQAGDDARMCEALKQASISLGSGYMTAGTAADELRDEGGSSDDISDLETMEGYFLE